VDFLRNFITSVAFRKQAHDLLAISLKPHYDRGMATLTFDTYNFIERLKSSGMEETQAKAIADGLKEIDLEYVASKEDVTSPLLNKL
jgi:hypothetical protein